MSDSLRYDIALPLLPEVGVKRAKDLYAYFGSSVAVFEADAATLQQIPNISTFTIERILQGRESALRRADQEVEFIQKHGIETYLFTDEKYPTALAATPDAPYMLFGKGNIPAGGHWLSVVGTRQPTEWGKDICHKIVLDLARMIPDLVIVSGLAYGIDVTSHKAALEAGIATVIIPGHGLDRIYPAVHRRVAVEALEYGGLLTEYMSGTQPERTNFIARNRIIAGLSTATLVVESKQKGGSLITADMASSYAREVLAVPGRVGDECSAGCNQLIKNDKARLIESADDIMHILGWKANDSKQEKAIQTTLFEQFVEEDKLILNALQGKDEGEHINALIEQLQMPYADLSVRLMQLEMQGYVRALHGGRYRRVNG